MKLYGSYTSPYVRHCHIALLENGFAFDFIETDQTASGAQSPTKRVPFLTHGEVFLTDSSSILKYIRELAGQQFMAAPNEFDQFCMVNTALDTTANLFFLQRDGVAIENYDYTRRQAERVRSSLAELDKLSLPKQPPYNDAQLRLACYLTWALFRKRITIDGLENLQAFLDGIQQYKPFADTAIPQS